MTEQAADRIWSGIDIPKTVAGVLAAVSAAVIGSFLGVAGTLAGAAVASLIGSVGTEIYHRSIDRGRKKIQGTFLAPAAVGTPPVEAAAEESPSETASDRRIRWGRVAMVAGALFVLAIGVLTTAELVSGRSIADATRGGAGDSTTLTSLFTDKSGNSEESPTPSPSSSSSPSSDETQPTDQATTDPAQQATTAPATEQPTEAPTTAAPTGDTGADSGTNTGSGKSDTRGADTQNPNDGTE